jgi:hypothetical protein
MSKRSYLFARLVIAACCISGIVLMHIHADQRSFAYSWEDGILRPWGSGLELLGILALAAIAITLLGAIIRHGTPVQRTTAISLIWFPAWYLGFYALRCLRFLNY